MTQLNTNPPLKQIGIRKLHHSLGAEVSGVNLAAPMGGEIFSYLCEALLKHKVLVFREQQLNTEQQITFARRFGPLDVHPTREVDEVNPHITRVTKQVKTLNQYIELNSDMTWRERPPMGSVMRVVAGPVTGSVGQFINMEAAYDALSDAKKDFTCSLRSKHDLLHALPDLSVRDSLQLKSKFPVQTHPLIRTHPETRNRILFIHKAYTIGVVGMSPQSSKWLLNSLFDTLFKPEHIFSFHWTPGTVVLWDNRSCQYHEDAKSVAPDHVMERVSITGDRPFFDPQIANTAIQNGENGDILGFKIEPLDPKPMYKQPSKSNAA
ncbi:TauD/TfdA dioxygenase family protein [Candidatus Phycosocius spiralis]|uniref:Taurine dioxygenase n=1 Tax=Candidatus Phycosocius spiralis TaxID=2815099 RepID=A0ABQ4PWX1_9PROT|nr:TauD/TfdA family dioxygenase [Candidatus Phycosocius spiralis]GIU67430.1 putative taurine dioxygenase [Candidatus Phycosocius spiralis]